MALLNSISIRLLSKRFPKEFIAGNSVRFYSDDPPIIRIDHCPGREQIGFGIDGDKDYFDRRDFPCPAVRYKRETPEIKLLRDKEKGDWKKLTVDEKKQLYRASFRMTFAEIHAPNGRFKSYLGWTCFFWGVGIWLWMAFYYARNRTTYRPSLSLESRQAQFQKYIAMRANPLDWPTKDWDYEKDDWKEGKVPNL